MAMGVSSGQGVPFYDPFYMASTTRASGYEDRTGLRGRYNDDFNMFNNVHISKPQSLSLSIPSAPAGVSQCQGTPRPRAFGAAAKTVEDESVVVGSSGGLPAPSV